MSEKDGKLNVTLTYRLTESIALKSNPSAYENVIEVEGHIINDLLPYFTISEYKTCADPDDEKTYNGKTYEDLSNEVQFWDIDHLDDFLKGVKIVRDNLMQICKERNITTRRI